MNVAKFGVPVLMAAALTLSACVPTTELEADGSIGSEVTTPEPPAATGDDLDPGDESIQPIVGDTDDAPADTGADSADTQEAETQEPVETAAGITPTVLTDTQCTQDRVLDRGDIKFAPGKEGATISGVLLAGDTDSYRFDALGGQVYTIDITSLEGDAEFALFSPELGEITSRNKLEQSGKLPESGTYEICVSTSGENATYAIGVGIAKPFYTEGPATLTETQCSSEPVLDRGEIGTVDGDFISTRIHQDEVQLGVDSYRFEARAGRHYAITIESDDLITEFDLFSPDTGNISKGEDEVAVGVFEETGTYEICVSPSPKNAPYILGLFIDSEPIKPKLYNAQ